ncbi:YdcF family protein [Rhodonellum sp.]|uniref:YdcF family protein n=1 Tax=Rhodonellum sp. TaxID=2231180 RepID=UPI002719148B|nr:YdcF family protein [Rhodonellum sp.]MDO9554927.1 YdcF family protein [Rhodonellum sp.]
MLVLTSVLSGFFFSVEFVLLLLLLFFFFKKEKSPAVSLLGLLFFLILMSPLSAKLVHWQERKFVSLQEVPEDFPVILVLGAGGVPEEGLSVYQRLDHAVLQRTLEGIRLWKLHPEKLLVFSSRGREGFVSQASMYAAVAMEQGVDPLQIQLIEKGVTTETEALDFIGEFPEVRKIVLVTSALHLSRASRIFERVGLEVIAAPADFQIKIHPGGNRLNWFPSLRALVKWNALLHEGIGLLWVEIRVMLGIFPVSEVLVSGKLHVEANQ